MHHLQKTIVQIIFALIFLSCWTIGIIFCNGLFLLPLYLFSFLSLLAVPFYLISYYRKEPGTSPSIFFRYIFIPFLLTIPCAYGIGKVNNWLFEITGQDISKEINEHKAAIDPRDPRDAKRFITNSHFLLSIHLNQVNYDDNNGMGHNLTRLYNLFGAFPWPGDYFWDGNKWVEYNPYANQDQNDKGR